MLWLVAIAGMLMGLIGLGTIYQVIATNSERRRFLPPGKSIDINGNSLHYKIMGEGNPTVVVDSGQGGTHLDWQLVQPEVAKFTQIVTYDRPGYGWSDLRRLEKINSQ